MKTAIVSAVINFLLSWTVLPLLIPPFRIYTLIELGEVLFWQVAGIVGWPIALLGGCVALLLQGTLTGLGNLAMVLIYPGVQIMLIHSYKVKRFGQWKLGALHIFITFSFAAIWYQVLNSYDFMVG